MSLNFDKNGKPLCKIYNGKYNNKIVYCNSEEDDEKTFTNLKLTGDAYFQQVPNTETEREIIYCCGPSGSGKSHYVKNYLKEYKKAFKQNQIYVFSALKEDETLDSLNGLKRIKIDKSLYEDPIPSSDFKNSCVVFDDIDVISDKKIREAVYSIMNQILELNRHFNTTCLITNHLATNGKDTRRILNEASTFVIYPSSGSCKGWKYLLSEYVGMDKKDMSIIKKSKSRWCCIYKNYPQVVMTQKEIYLLSNNDD
jgi:hypothetical protein